MLSEPRTQVTCPNCRATIANSANFCGQCGASIVTSTKSVDPHVGQVVAGRYRIQERLATGGMGEIYTAKHETLAQRVAVKLLHRRYASDEKVVKRFFNEARSFCRVKHPYAVGMLDFGRLQDGTLYLVTEFIDGKPLNLFVANYNGLSSKVAVRLARQMAEVLAAAHEEQIIHRDLKPDNIIVTSGLGGRWSVKLLDFGIAKILDDDAQGLTRTGAVFGTPEFMSPEQAQGLPVSFAGDIYSFGAVLFYMLTGMPPFTCKDRPKVLQMQIGESPPLAEIGKDQPVPQELVDLVGQCLEKKPDDRPASFLAVLETLERIEARIAEQMPTVPDMQEQWDAPAVSAESPVPTQPERSSVNPPDTLDMAEVDSGEEIELVFEQEGGPYEDQSEESSFSEDLKISLIDSGPDEAVDEGFSWGAEAESDIFAEPFDTDSGDLQLAELRRTHTLSWIFVAFGIVIGAVAAAFYLGIFDPVEENVGDGSGGQVAPQDGTGDVSDQVSSIGGAEGTGSDQATETPPPEPIPERPFNVVGAGRRAGIAAMHISEAEIEEAVEVWEGAVALLAEEGVELPTYPIAATLERAVELMDTADGHLRRERCRRADASIVEMGQISHALMVQYYRPLNDCWERVREEEEGRPPSSLGD